MKKYRTKPWAKGLACGLFVLAMTVSVICLGNVRWLAYHGGYQWEGTRQLVEEEEAVWVENLTNQLADGYRSYRDGDQSLDVKRYVEDENFFFTIKDLEGNTLLASDTLGDYREKTSWSMQVGGTVQWSHIDQYYDSYEARDLALDQLGSTYEELQNVSLVEDEEGYRLTADVARTVGKETVVLTGFLRSELSPTGQVYQGIQYAENMGFYRYEFLAGAILGLVLGLLSLGFLLWSAGLRQEGSEEVSLRWMDRAIPTDLLIAAGAAVLLFGLLPVVCSSGWGTSLVAFGPTVLTMVLMGVVLAMALSLVRRRRGGIGRENLFFPRLIRPVRRWGKALGRRTGELLGKLPLFWAAGLGFLLLCFLEGLCLMGCYYGGGWVVLWLLLKVLEGGLVLFVVLSMRTLQAGGRQLAAGILAQEILEVDHRNILAQQFDGLGKHFLAAIHILHVQQVDRVEQNLQVRAADLVQHGAGASGIVHDVLDHRLNGNGHAVLLGAAHHRLEVLDKGSKGGIAAALRAELVLRVGCTGLGAHHAAAQQAGKADMRVVLFLNGVQSICIRVRQIQVVAQHRNVQLIFCKQTAQIGRVAGGKGRRGVGHLLQGFAQCQMHAGKALLAYQRQHLFNGQLFCVVQT